MQQQNVCQNFQQKLSYLPNMPATPTPVTATSQTTSTSTSSTSRHYVDKARLIQLVHDNPILWDCRLPNYKRADKSKTEQWNHLGVIFNVSGERVQRTFTSLREIFRRELNNEKLLGRRFKSKWEFYKSMSFLRDVIRERKPRERHAAKVKRRNQLSPSLNNTTLSSSNGIDEYQYFAPNDPNNPSIQQQPATNQEQQLVASNDASSHSHQNNSTQISVLNLLTQLSNGGGVVLSSNHSQKNCSSSTTTAQQQSYQQQEQQQLQQQSIKHANNDDDDINMAQATSPATSTTPSMYIKDEIEIPDDDEDEDIDEEDSTSITFNGEVLFSNNNKSKVSDTTMISNDDNDNEPLKRVSKLKRNDKNRFQLQQWKRCNKSYHEDIGDADDDDGSSVESVPNKNMINNNTTANGNEELKAQLNFANINEHMSTVGGGSGGANGIGGHSLIGSNGNATNIANPFGAQNVETELKYRRHLVYTKFADFMVAKMDSMNEREADDLMDRMMLVIAQKH